AAIPLARALDRKVIISTATAALQEQLVSRDIPAFLAATGIPAEVSIAKGRQRYACRRNLFELGAGAEQHALDFGDPEHVPLWPRPPKEGEVKLVQALAASAALRGWDGHMDVPPQAIPDALRPLITTTSG